METMGLLTPIKTFPSKLRRLCVKSLCGERLEEERMGFLFPLCLISYPTIIIVVETLSYEVKWF